MTITVQEYNENPPKPKRRRTETIIDPAKLMNCPNCPRSFPSKKKLNDHNNMHHKLKRCYENSCKHLPEFIGSKSYQVHMNQFHKKDRSDECRFCQKVILFSVDTFDY